MKLVSKRGESRDDFRVMFSDLSDGIQNRILGAFGLSSESDRNWDILPICFGYQPFTDQQEIDDAACMSLGLI